MKKTILKLAKSVEPCQRNWQEDYIIPNEHIKYVIKSAISMPTKQNKTTYELFCVTNKDLIYEIYKLAYNPDDKFWTYLKNPQVNANCLLIWSFNKQKESDADRNVNIGISAGAAALAAAELGYKTGFCKCFLVDELKALLTDEDFSPALILGFGLPNTNFKRIDRVENGERVGVNISKGPKKINVHMRP